MKQAGLLLYSWLLTVSIFAQHISIGLKNGVNISMLGDKSRYEMRSKAGFHGGLLTEIRLKASLGLQTEIAYSSQGAKYTTNDGTEHTLFLNYISIPLRLQYKVNNGFRLQTGPQIEFLVKLKDKIGDNVTYFFTSQDFKTIDFSWDAGLGYLSYSGFGVDGHYNFSINNISNGGVNEFKNNVFQLDLFYILNHHHKATSSRHSKY